MRPVVLLALAVVMSSACGSQETSPDAGRATATSSPKPEIELEVARAGSSSRSSQPQCAPVPAIKLPQAPCDHDLECALTDLAAACDACNLDRAYPVPRLALAHRILDCRHATSSTALDVCGRACPKHDDYTGAFYKAQCREHRCIAYRYHGGG